MELAKENIDPPDEVDWGAKMADQRRKFLIKTAQETKNDTSESGSSKKEKESRPKDKLPKIKEISFVDSDSERTSRLRNPLRSSVSCAPSLSKTY